MVWDIIPKTVATSIVFFVISLDVEYDDIKLGSSVRPTAEMHTKDQNDIFAMGMFSDRDRSRQVVVSNGGEKGPVQG